MIKMRADQMQALDRDAEERFIDKLVNYLREKQTIWVARNSDEELRKRVKSSIRRAQSHGFTTERTIAKYSGLMFRWAPNFDECPAMKEVLDHTELDEETRVDRLYELSDEQWEAAMRRYDPAAWDEEFD